MSNYYRQTFKEPDAVKHIVPGRDYNINNTTGLVEYNPHVSPELSLKVAVIINPPDHSRFLPLEELAIRLLPDKLNAAQLREMPTYEVGARVAKIIPKGLFGDDISDNLPGLLSKYPAADLIVVSGHGRVWTPEVER